MTLFSSRALMRTTLFQTKAGGFPATVTIYQPREGFSRYELVQQNWFLVYAMLPCELCTLCSSGIGMGYPVVSTYDPCNLYAFRRLETLYKRTPRSFLTTRSALVPCQGRLSCVRFPFLIDRCFRVDGVQRFWSFVLLYIYHVEISLD